MAAPISRGFWIDRGDTLPMSSNTLPERGDQGAQPAAIPPLVAHIALLYFPKFA
jgi:hypothetical protein